MREANRASAAIALCAALRAVAAAVAAAREGSCSADAISAITCFTAARAFCMCKAGDSLNLACWAAAASVKTCTGHAEYLKLAAQIIALLL